MTKQRVLTGITTTGTPHLGNYVGAIKPAIAASKQAHVESFLFLADYHALIKCQDPEQVAQSTLEIAATWLALGLDPNNTVFYRQSDIPEIAELCWVLNCVAAKGLLNRAHAYKDAVAKNVEAEQDNDFGITMGLFSYPVLMAADILMFNADIVPVGSDQIQHLEMARDIGQRFNHIYGETFALPQAQVDETGAVLPGLDGRKMSKSYGNTITLFDTSKKLQKSINKIKTNLLEPGDPKDPSDSAVYALWQAFATSEQRAYMAEQFAAGIAWGQAKKELHALIDAELAAPRERYNELMADPREIERILQEGAHKARETAAPMIAKVRGAIGIRPLG